MDIWVGYIRRYMSRCVRGCMSGYMRGIHWWIYGYHHRLQLFVPVCYLKEVSVSGIMTVVRLYVCSLPNCVDSSAALLDADALDDFEPGAPIGNSAAPTQDADETASDGTEGAVAAGPSSAAIAVFDKKRRDYYSEKLYESEQAITK